MKLQPFQKRTWANIDLDAAEHNYNIIREQLKPETKICCVVKANGYGHGSVQLSRFYESMKADYLAVSNIEEAIQTHAVQLNLHIRESLSVVFLTIMVKLFLTMQLSKVLMLLFI